MLPTSSTGSSDVSAPLFSIDQPPLIMMRAEENTPLLGHKRGRRRSKRQSSRERDAPIDYDKDEADRDQQQVLSSEETAAFSTPVLTRQDTPQSRRRNRALPQDGFSMGVGSFEKLEPDNVPAETPPRQTQQKQDRRSVFQRARQFVRKTIHFPTLGYQNLEFDTTESWKCSLGTRESDGTWLNYSDKAGTAMALLVWVLIGYCSATMIVLARRGHLRADVAAAQCTINLLIWSCHAKTMLTDPGTIPSTAVPLVTEGVKFHTMCSVCQSYKPKCTHHCRICNRCISRMDHHCPW